MMSPGIHSKRSTILYVRGRRWHLSLTEKTIPPQFPKHTGKAIHKIRKLLSRCNSYRFPPDVKYFLTKHANP